jgi:hypothetical protein
MVENKENNSEVEGIGVRETDAEMMLNQQSSMAGGYCNQF